MTSRCYGAGRLSHTHLLFALLLLLSLNYAACGGTGTDITAYLQNGSGGITLNSGNNCTYLSASVSGLNSAINITATNITLDCAGYAMSGLNTTANTRGVYITSTFANVSNCNINGFDDAIYLSGASSAYIANNSLSTTKTSGGYNSGEAIYEEVLSGATFINNTLTTSPGAGTAMLIYNGIANNQLINNTINAKGTNGYSAVAGIYFDQDGNSNNLTGNAITCTAGTYCVDVWEGGKSYITNNTISGSTYSFYTATSTGTYSCANNNFLNTILITTSGNSFNSDRITTTSGISFYFSTSQNNSLVNESITSSGGTAALYYTSGAGNGQIINSTINSSTVAAWFESGAANMTIAGDSIYGGSATYGTFHIDAGANTGFMIANNSLYSPLTNTTILYTAGTLKNSQLINNTFIAKASGVNYVYLTAASGNNTFYWNNFTNTSGQFVNDLNGSNNFNASIGGVQQGNIWGDVFTLGWYSSFGNVSCGAFSGCLVGDTYNSTSMITTPPTLGCYNSTNGKNKVSSNVQDCFPLVNNGGICIESDSYAPGTSPSGTIFSSTSLNVNSNFTYSPALCFAQASCVLQYLNGTIYQNQTVLNASNTSFNFSNIASYLTLNLNCFVSTAYGAASSAGNLTYQFIPAPQNIPAATTGGGVAMNLTALSQQLVALNQPGFLEGVLGAGDGVLNSILTTSDMWLQGRMFGIPNVGLALLLLLLYIYEETRKTTLTMWAAGAIIVAAFIIFRYGVMFA